LSIYIFFWGWNIQLLSSLVVVFYVPLNRGVDCRFQVRKCVVWQEGAKLGIRRSLFVLSIRLACITDQSSLE